MNIDLKDEILEFINRRFKVDCKWTDGNCYYFALMLKERFGGEIYYVPIEGHFVCKIGEKYYDFRGQCQRFQSKPLTLETIAKNDINWYNRIWKDCIR